MKTSSDEEELTIISNADTQGSAHKVVDRLDVELLTEAGESAVHLGREFEGNTDSSSESSSDSSAESSVESSSGTATSSDGCSGSSSSSGFEVSASKLFCPNPTQRCNYVAQVPSDRKPVQRCTYATQLQSWTEKIPIGLGLCPWAGKSHSQGRLRFVTCEGDTPSDVAQLILTEAEMLTRGGVAPLSSTLVVCPYVAAWKDFKKFDDWVKSGIHEEVKGDSIRENIELVPFHPEFLRWRGLPDGVTVGSVVQSFTGTLGRKRLHNERFSMRDPSSEVKDC